jgi:hypothetical protein
MKTTSLTRAARAALEQRRQTLIEELATLAPFCRGSVHPFTVRRGDKEWQYYSWEVGSGAARVSHTLRVGQVEQIQRGIARRQAYEAWRRRFEQTMEACCVATLCEDEKKTPATAAAPRWCRPKQTAAPRRWQQPADSTPRCSTARRRPCRSKRAFARCAAPR